MPPKESKKRAEPHAAATHVRSSDWSDNDDDDQGAAAAAANSPNPFWLQQQQLAQFEREQQQQQQHYGHHQQQLYHQGAAAATGADDWHTPRRKTRSSSSSAAKVAAAQRGDDGKAYNSDDERHAHDGRGSGRYRDDADFENGLREHRGFVIERMKEDGACLFRAVAFHVYGDQEMHGTVRDRCMDYMAKNRDHFAQFVTEDFGAYLARKRHDACHGNHLEIQAMSEMYNRNIEVYSYDDVPINTFRIEGSTDAPIRVSYHGGVHYNAVVDPNLSTFGVGLGFSDLKPGEADAKLMKQAMQASDEELLEKELLKETYQMSEEEELQRAIEEAILAESRAEYLRSLQRPK